VSPGIRAVLLEIRRAMKDQAPRIADPIIDRAVDSKRITAQQADRIRERPRAARRARARIPAGRAAPVAQTSTTTGSTIGRRRRRS
jgi:hypothetical protein